MAKVVALGPMFCLGESRAKGEEFEMTEADAKAHETAGLVFVGTKAAFEKKVAEAQKQSDDADAKARADADKAYEQQQKAMQELAEQQKEKS